MDHDAYTSDLQNFVDVVYSIFNVATGVEPELNQEEIATVLDRIEFLKWMKRFLRVLLQMKNAHAPSRNTAIRR